MTTRLYYTDAYQTEFAATVIAQSDDLTRAYLDETAFYPTSGGQLHDLGTLGGASVVDVIDEDSRIAHVLSAPVALTGSITGRVDWARRYDHMQQHTGQHLISAVFDDMFAAKTLSVHFGADYSTVDLDTDSLSRDKLVKAEQRSNAIVSESRPVTVTFEEAASALGLRKPSDRAGTLRVVTIDRADRSACGGTHVRTTAEIGVVLLRGVEKIRKATRVEFICGERAVKRARRDFESLSTIATSLSASLEDVGSLVGAQAERVKESEGARRKLERDLSAYRARERYDATVPDANGIRTIVVRDAASMEEIKDLAQASFAFPRMVLVGGVMTPPSVLLASSEDSGLDAGKTLKEQLAAAGGRGGGSPRLAQGSVPDAAAVDAVVARLMARE